MPDKDGKLSKEEKDKAVHWLEERWPEPRTCPISGHDTWIIGDHLVTPLVWSQGDILVGGSVYPLVMVICEACGYTQMFNAVLLGITKKRDSQDG